MGVSEAVVSLAWYPGCFGIEPVWLPSRISRRLLRVRSHKSRPDISAIDPAAVPIPIPAFAAGLSPLLDFSVFGGDADVETAGPKVGEAGEPVVLKLVAEYVGFAMLELVAEDVGCVVPENVADDVGFVGLQVTVLRLDSI